jgi:putative spermidine/putrescine transport system permease protein
MKRLVDNLSVLLIGVFLAFVMAIIIAPFLYSVVMSFDPRSYLGSFPPPGLSGRWYAKFFSDERYMAALRTSLSVGLLSSVLASVLGALAAFGLLQVRSHRRRVWLDGFLAAPKLVPNVIVGFALLLAFAASGVRPGMLALTAAHCLITLPLVVRSVSAALQGIRPSLVEAAMSLGATRARALWDIVVPLARTGIVVGFVFALAVSLDEVAASAFLTTTDDVTLPVVLISDMKANFDLTIAAAAVLQMAAIILVVVVLDIVVGLDRLFGEGSYGHREE